MPVAGLIIISIFAILLSILFGNTGGFIPTVPAGTGGAPAPAPDVGGQSRWLRFDDDGDIEATDPVNGQKRTFVNNGDGTYTDPVSGTTYTPQELSEQMEHRADNAAPSDRMKRSLSKMSAKIASAIRSAATRAVSLRRICSVNNRSGPAGRRSSVLPLSWG